jgi:hypothetical protein
MQIEISEDGFINAVRALNGGAVIEELDREIIKAVQAIFDHGGSSEISLKLKISRIAGLEKAVRVGHDVSAKHPKEKRPEKAMFVSRGSGLTDQNQEQDPLPLGDEVQPRRPILEAVTRIAAKGDGDGFTK